MNGVSGFRNRCKYIQRTRRYFACEPIRFTKAQKHRDEALLYLLWGKLGADLVKALNGLFAHQRLFNSSQVLQRREQNMSMLRPAHIFYKVAELFTQGCKDFIFIFNRFCETSAEPYLR